MNNILYFGSKYLKRTFEKSRMKLRPSDMFLVCSIYSKRSNMSNILALKI